MNNPMLEPLSVKGHCDIRIIDGDGTERHVQVNNLITNHGLSVFANRVAGLELNTVLWGTQFGTGTTAPTPEDTGVAATIGIVKKYSDVTAADNISTHTVEYAAGEIAATSVTELGFFSHDPSVPSTYILMSRVVFDAIQITPQTSVVVKWHYTFQGV